MTSSNDKYEAVIGLEVHAQLNTKTKAFCGDFYEYGSAPNTQVSPISLGHPGTLPKPNIEALKLALKMGLACNGVIHKKTHYSRKNYFYADLPKGYQITQYTNPICTAGTVVINTAEGGTKSIRLDKIILEEDSGKSIHDLDPFASLIDLNRAGVPLIEIVSEPDMCLPEEAYQYLTEIRKTVRYLDICDGNMEEGSLRCDANVSIRLRGSKEFNTKVEIKNLNSIRNVQRAIAHEIVRQTELVEKGGRVAGETRGFDPVKGETFSMRAKELVNDYRYFPEPDIPPCVVTDEDIEKIRAMMPELPRELHKRLVSEFGLSEYDAGVIVAEKESADYFQEIVKLTENYKAAANWINGPVRSYLNENAVNFDDFFIKAENIAEIIKLVDEDKMSFSVASQKLFPELLKRKGDANVAVVISELNLVQEGNDDVLINYIREAISAYPEKVAEYKAGKKGLLGLFMGEVMKKSGGKADPKKTNKLLAEELEK